MSLIARVQDDLKAARLARSDQTKIGLLRMVVNHAMTESKKELREPNDDDALAAIKYYSKGAADIIAKYKEHNVPIDDRYEQAFAEIAILNEYLPKQFSINELIVMVNNLVVAAGDNAKAGPLLGQLKKMHGDAVDAVAAKRLIEDALNAKAETAK